jgi:hypothetical protein
MIWQLLVPSALLLGVIGAALLAASRRPARRAPRGLPPDMRIEYDMRDAPDEEPARTAFVSRLWEYYWWVAVAQALAIVSVVVVAFLLARHWGLA